MDTKRIRAKLLDLAVRGKLVSQDPVDEPAAVLLERIREERAKLIKEKIIRAPKDGESVIFKDSDGSRYEKRGAGEPVCIDNEIPFEVPEGWEWARLETLMEEPRYGTSKKSSADGAFPVLRMGNITRTGVIDYSDLVYTSDECDIREYALRKGDVVFNRTNSKEWVGKTAYYDGSLSCIIAGYLIRIRPVLIDGRYLNFAMCSPYEREWCSRVKTDGVNQSNISAHKLKSLLVPVPPLAEQRRIVAELGRLLSLVGSVERDSADLGALRARARAKVLDLAVRGRLVPQDPSDEPASALLARAAVERRALVGEGRAKAPKGGWSVIERRSDGTHYEKRGDGEPVPVEVPYDLPEGWAWARLLDLYILNPKNNVEDSVQVSFLPMSAIDEGYENAIHPANRMWRDVKKGFTQFADGDIVFAKISPCFENGKYFIAKSLVNGIGAGTTELYVLRPTSNALLDMYTFLYLESPLFVRGACKTFMGTVGQQRIKRDYIEAALIPVPPLAEQQRIIDTAKLFLDSLTSL